MKKHRLVELGWHIALFGVAILFASVFGSGAAIGAIFLYLGVTIMSVTPSD